MRILIQNSFNILIIIFKYVDDDILKYQVISSDFYSKVIPKAFKIDKTYGINMHTHKDFEKFYVYAKNRVYSVSFVDIITNGNNLKWSGKKIKTDSGATTYEDDYLNWKGNDY